MMGSLNFSFFFFNDTATTEIYTLSLHDALPISRGGDVRGSLDAAVRAPRAARERAPHYAGIRQHPAAGRAHRDRKSTRLNSSHGYISYAVFCLKKKKKKQERSAETLRTTRQW